MPLNIIINNQKITELPADLYIPPQALKVFLEMFEGPLDLLLYLIRQQNFDILQIPIAKITDQYIHYINAMQTLNIELAAEYLLMAAMLIEIKSRLLLPSPPATNSSEEDNRDPRQELIERLIEYEKIKQASIKLNQRPQALRDYLWVEVMVEESAPTFAPISTSDLQQAWHTLLLRSLKVQEKHQIKKQELSVREHMSQILRHLQNCGRSNFYALFEVELGSAYVIVNFIAILELAKEGLVNLEQDHHRNIFVELV